MHTVTVNVDTINEGKGGKICAYFSLFFFFFLKCEELVLICHTCLLHVKIVYFYANTFFTYSCFSQM